MILALVATCSYILADANPFRDLYVAVGKGVVSRNNSSCLPVAENGVCVLHPRGHIEYSCYPRGHIEYSCYPRGHIEYSCIPQGVIKW